MVQMTNGPILIHISPCIREASASQMNSQEGNFHIDIAAVNFILCNNALYSNCFFHNAVNTAIITKRESSNLHDVIYQLQFCVSVYENLCCLEVLSKCQHSPFLLVVQVFSLANILSFICWCSIFLKMGEEGTGGDMYTQYSLQVYLLSAIIFKILEASDILKMMTERRDLERVLTVCVHRCAWLLSLLHSTMEEPPTNKDHTLEVSSTEEVVGHA